MFAYVGSRTSKERNARGEGISVFKISPETGILELVQIVGDLFNPSFLALNSIGDRLYAVHGDSYEVSAFSVNTVSGEITYINSGKCGGKNPVHLALDPSEENLIISNHLSHNISVVALDNRGAIGEVTQTVELVGQPGPHRAEQPFSKPHFNPFDPSGRFVVVPDKGLDCLFTYEFVAGALKPAPKLVTETRETAGPRHIAFHPTSAYAYAVNELDSTVTCYKFNTTKGELQPFQVTSTLPDTYTGNSRASEIEIDATGRFLYASNRGYDSIAVFAVEPATGRVLLRQVVPSLGKTPRYFKLSPSGHVLYALNEDSDNIALLEVSATEGTLSYTGKTFDCKSPVCMVFSKP